MTARQAGRDAADAAAGRARVRTEVCVESLDGVRIAIDAGADRVELCTALELDGLTPPPELIEQAVAAAAGTGLAVHVLIRCRAGDFVYDDAEIGVMAQQLRSALAAGADGLVIGALRPDRTVDRAAIDRWVEAADGQKLRLKDDIDPGTGDPGVRATSFDHRHDRMGPAVTFHRAFDQVVDPLVAIADLQAAGIDRILTSGQAPTAPEGEELLARLVSRAGELGTGNPAAPITVLAGGGIRPINVAGLIGRTGVTEVHFSGRNGTIIDRDMVAATVVAARSAPQD